MPPPAMTISAPPPPSMVSLPEPVLMILANERPAIEIAEVSAGIEALEVRRRWLRRPWSDRGRNVTAKFTAVTLEPAVRIKRVGADTAVDRGFGATNGDRVIASAGIDDVDATSAIDDIVARALVIAFAADDPVTVRAEDNATHRGSGNC